LITVRTPLTPDLREPIERRITCTMYEGVQAAWRAAAGEQEAAKYFPTPNGYHPVLRPSVAMEVCSALARIGDRGRSGYELRFTWSPDVPFKGHMTAFEFTPRLLADVARAARELRGRV
jgi:hypothetical protein